MGLIFKNLLFGKYFFESDFFLIFFPTLSFSPYLFLSVSLYLS